MSRRNPWLTPDMAGEAKRQDAEAAKESLALRDVLDTASGREVLHRLLERAGVMNEISDKSADVYRKAAVQEFGLWLLREMYAAHPAASMAIVNRILSERTGNGTTK